MVQSISSEISMKSWKETLADTRLIILVTSVLSIHNQSMNSWIISTRMIQEDSEREGEIDLLGLITSAGISSEDAMIGARTNERFASQ